MNARHVKSLASLLLAFSVQHAAGQSNALYPAPIRMLSFDAGYAFRLGSSPNERYYRFTYNGALVREAGTPFKSARGLDLLAPKDSVASGDVPALVLRFEDGAASVGGGLLEALGTKELPLPGITSLGLRGTSRLAADERLEHLTAAVGLETPPARVPGLGRTGISNWIVLGVNAERREATDSGTPDINVALATFRTFVGTALGWRKSADPAHTAGKIVHDILEAAPTNAVARALADSLGKIDDSKRTPLQQLVLDAVSESVSDDAWETTVRDLATGTADAITDQPTAAVYAEWSGWVDLASEPAEGRARSLFTATLDYWPFANRDDVLLRIRYEIGYERALPGERRNQFLASVAVRF